MLGVVRSEEFEVALHISLAVHADVVTASEACFDIGTFQYFLHRLE